MAPSTTWRAVGAQPSGLTAGFILEEGLELEVLGAIAQTMGKAAANAGVGIVTGDTKVVGRGSADQLFVNTAGVGVVPDGCATSDRNARAPATTSSCRATSASTVWRS